MSWANQDYDTEKINVVRKDDFLMWVSQDQENWDYLTLQEKNKLE